MENDILGQMLIDNNIVTDSQVQESDFVEIKNKIIYRSILECLDKGMIADIVSVSKFRGVDIPYLSKLTDIGTTANWRFYEKELLLLAKKRKLKRLSVEFTDWINNNTPEEVITNLEDALMDITSATDKDRIYEVKDMIGEYIENLETKYKAKGSLPGLRTGISKLDDYILGFQKKLLYYVGARPSQGKSALILNFLSYIALRENVPAGILSAESSKEEILNRIYSQEGRINSIHLSTGFIDHKVMSGVFDVSDRLNEKHIFIYDKPNMNLNDVKSQARRMVRVHKCKIIFVDFIQNIFVPNKPKPIDRVSEVSMGLKALARELDVPIVVAAQLRRDSEGRRPTMADFSDSSQIEKDADVAIMIYHKEENESYLLVEKVRDGKTGSIPVHFERRYVKFYKREQEA